MSKPTASRDNITLCGFMGCGKSTVGQTLAEMLGAPFIDTDALVEQTAGISVKDLFARFGEARFRTLETNAIESLPRHAGLVISVGGGAVLSPRNVEALRAGGKVVLIDVPAALIEKRLLTDASRPLLNTPGRSAELRRLYDARMPAYRAAADLAVTGNEGPAADVAWQIVRALGLAVPAPEKNI